MAVNTWNGSSSTDFATAANWTTTGVTDRVPTVADDVIIPDTSSINKCDLDQARNINSFVLAPDGEFDQGGTLFIKGKNAAGEAVKCQGKLGDVSDFTVETQSAATVTLTKQSGLGVFRDIAITHADGVITLGAAATIQRNLTITAGQLNTDASSNYALTVTGDVTIAASGTLTCNSSTVIVNSFTISSGGTLSAPDASGSLTLNGTLSAWSFQNNSTNFSHNNGTITQTAAGHIKSVSSNPMYNFTLNSSSSDSHAAVFRPSSGTDCVIAANNVTVTRGLLQVNTHSHTMSMGSLTIGSTGTFEASSTTTTITGGASVTTNRCLQDSGTFTHNDGTLNITGTNWGGSNYAHIHTASGIELGNVTINAGGADAKYYQFRCGSGTFNFNNVYVKSGEMRDYNNNNTFNIRGNLDIGTRGAGGTNAAFFGSDARDNAYTTKFIVAGLVTTYTNGQFHVAYGTDGTDGCKIGGLRNVGGTVYGDTA